MNIVLLKQKKPQQVIIFGSLILAFVPFVWYFDKNSIDKVILLLAIGLLLVGYSTTYEINKKFDNRKRIKLFGITVFRERLKLYYPEYISIFSTSFKKDNHWAPVAALGTESKYKDIVVKFFKGSKNVVIYKCNDYNIALNKPTELGLLLNIKVHNTVKQSST